MLLDNQQLTFTIQKLIPVDSPNYKYFQFTLIDLIRQEDFIFQIHDSFIVDDAGTPNVKQVQSEIRSAKKTEEWAVTYLLASFLEKYHHNDKALSFLKKYLHVLILIAYRNNKQDNKVNNLCLRVRMALDKHKSQHRILEKLIEIHHIHQQIENVFAEIESFEQDIKIKEDSGESQNDNLSQKIAQIRYAYEVAIKDKPAVQVSRRRKSTDNNRLKNEKIRQVQKLDPTDSDSSIRSINTLEVENDSNTAEAEKIADVTSDLQLDNNFEPTPETKTSNQLQTEDTRKQYKHSKRNHFQFPTNTRIQTPENYQLLVSKLWGKISDAGIKQDDGRIYAIILLTLITGRSINQICDELATDFSKRSFFITKEIVDYRVTIDITKNRRDGIKPVRKSDTNFINFQLPAKIQSMIRFKFSPSEAEITQKLKELRSELGLAVLSQQHIDNGLRFLIKQVINEPLHANIITGIDVKHASPLYYTSLDKEIVLHTYDSTIDLLNKKVSKNLIADEAEEKLSQKSPSIVSQKTVYIGSDMALDEKTVQQFFQELADWVTSYNGKKSKNTPNGDEYILQFQAYTIWLWFVILLLTGMRPVNHAPGFLNQINLKQKIMWVSDKEVRQTEKKINKGGDGRLIPMCDFLITALENYMKFIQRFATQHNITGTAKPFHLQDILQSQLPLLQFYNFHKKTFESIKPKSVSNYLKDFIQHQDNWLRHQTRTMLTGKTSETLINALYGHEYADQEAWHPFSSLPINEFKSLRNQLQQIAVSLHLEQIEVN